MAGGTRDARQANSGLSGCPWKRVVTARCPAPRAPTTSPDRQSDDGSAPQTDSAATLPPLKPLGNEYCPINPRHFRHGIRFAEGTAVASSAERKDIELVRLPKPPRTARVDLPGNEHSESGILPIAARVMEPTSLTPASLLPELASSRRPEPAPKRPSLEGLLRRAEILAQSMAVSDPRGRLLQVALLRRDHTLLDAVVRSADSSYVRQSRATWRPLCKRTKATRSVMPPSLSPRRHTTERPTANPRRSR